MISISFKQFCIDFKKYYNIDSVEIRTQSDMDEDVYEIYDSEDYEVDYENKIINLYDKDLGN